jgi:cell shape-determining protein MreD
VKTVDTFMVLLAAFLAVFVESATGTRGLLGAQIDLLPAIIVYAALHTGLATVALIAVLGGTWFDSLSANPPGLTMVPLFLIGFVIHQRRELILRDQVFAQFVLGLAASAFTPLAELLLLFTAGRAPLAGWGTLWQWVVMAGGGGLLTPVCFGLFRFVRHAFFYEPLTQNSFRHDRQIRRGRR